MAVVVGMLRCQCCGYVDVIEVQGKIPDPIIVGHDLGKTQDPSALSAWKRYSHEGQSHYECVLLQRWKHGSSYSNEIVPQTSQFMRMLPNSVLVIDYGQVGSAILELYQNAGLLVDAINSTGGGTKRGWNRDEKNGHYNVAKVFLCGVVQKLLSGGRIHVDRKKLGRSSQPWVEQLKQEMLNFNEKNNPEKGTKQLGTKREKGSHFDLALSAAVAMFVGEHGGFGGIDTTPNDEARGDLSRASKWQFEQPAGLEDYGVGRRW